MQPLIIRPPSLICNLLLTTTKPFLLRNTPNNSPHRLSFVNQTSKTPAQSRPDPALRVPLMSFGLFYFLNMSCSGPGRNFRTVSRMLSSSSSSSSPHPLGIAFFGRVRDPSQACSMAAFSSASFSSFFFSPYWMERVKKSQLFLGKMLPLTRMDWEWEQDEGW